MVIVVREEPFWDMVGRLRQFEGWRCLWRLPVAAFAYVVGPLLLLGGTVLAAFIAGSDFDLRTAVVAALVASIVGVVLFPRFTQLRLHRKIVANRLWTFEKPNTPTEVPALLRSEDVEAARVVLRRAQFNPQAFGLSLAVPPDDASDLDYKIAVQEPEAWPQADSPEDRTERIVGVLRAAGLRARVGGVDTFRGPE